MMNQVSFLLLVAFALGTALSGCRDMEDAWERPQLRPQRLVSVPGDYLAGDQPCEGMITYDIAYEIRDSAEFFGHDFALRVLTGPPTDLGGCVCDSLYYCVTLTFPIQDVAECGFKNDSAPHAPVMAVPNGLGGYQGFTDPRLPANTPMYQQLRVCAPQDSARLVYFNLLANLSPGYDLNDAVLEVEGICIVDNVEDTSDPIDPGGSGGGLDPGDGNVPLDPK